MPANVETMYYVSNDGNQRFVPWHGLGTPVETAPNSAEALKLAGLDWKVISENVYDKNGHAIPGYRANVRSSDNTVLGVVSPKYKIVQNAEAFAFTDNLIGNGVTYETAGSLQNGHKIWLLAKLPETKILNDKVDPYICFTNTHDGTGAVRVCCTPIRIVCQNTLNFALDTAKRAWSTRHMGDIQGKLSEARETLKLTQIYMDALNKEAEKLAEKKLSDGELEKAFDSIYVIDMETTARQLRNIQQMKENLFKCLAMPDVKQYKGTAWGAAMAITDMADHCAANRMPDSYQANNFNKILVGHPFVDQMFAAINQ